ncbi:copper homeostasis protein CutC [Umbelopsis sp. AD052]|nr:copper homeostasis protein CutC [Umbelopsis sp. AD052]
MQRPLIEICVDSADAAYAAEKCGAHRIELCSSVKALGGVTPSAGTILTTLKAIKIPVMVIVRPRGGDFLYTELEFESMIQDIHFVKQAGAHGVVIGILTADGKVDMDRNRRIDINISSLIEAARPMEVTFHRAFDMVADPVVALDDLIHLGVDRVLTSGQQKTAVDGIDLLADLQKHAKDKIIIMPGCGINQHTVRQIMQHVEPTEIHLSALKTVKGGMLYRNIQASMSSDSSNEQEYNVDIADTDKINAVIKALE